ncbi:uncharacterized protein [Medicago truncatula]|uniref:uncharacterized protein n=1 Tax=Medicago truncatula TaxID=3880 RepID=UPI000D2F3605|nr:uncharacterized protein LOC112418630 [Medicago truncatula]
MENLVDNSELRAEGNLMNIWSLRVLQKVKVFLWRAARGCLPTKHRLQTRSVHVCDRCVQCESSYENDWYVFFGCAKLEEVRSAADLWHIIQDNLETADDFVALFFKLLESLHHQQLFDFVMTLWCIWKRRNNKLWNDVETQPRILVNMAHDVLFQWQQVRVHQRRREHGEYHNSVMTDHRQKEWTKPVVGEVKCNVDATIFKEQGC